MKLISSREALNFLSQAAPRPWAQRLLRWMAFAGELDAYSNEGKVQAHSVVMQFTAQLVKKAGEFSGPKMDAAIKVEYSDEMAAKLIGRNHQDRFDDDPVIWSTSEEPRRVDIGFFLYASDIDFDQGYLEVDWFEVGDGLSKAIFPSDDLFGTDLDNPDYEAEVRGLSFEFSQIELLLPQLELRQSSGFMAEPADKRHSVGRPPKWDWEGALASVIAQANHPDGLPTGSGAQARIEEMMANWFMRTTGDAPAESQIRQRAAKIMRTIKRP
jgi:hypothetical protein